MLRRCFFATLLVFSAGLDQALGYDVSRKEIDNPTSQVGYRTVYGVIEFQVDKTGTPTQTKKLWKEVVLDSFGKSTKQGNYVVTLEVKKGEETVGRQVIASYNIAKIVDSVPIVGGLFGYDKKTEEILTESNTQWTGRIFADPILVEEKNNVLRVELATYFSDTNEVNPKLFSAAAELVNVVRGLPLLGDSAIGISAPAVVNLSSLLDTQLFGSDKKKLVTKGVDSALMTFIAAGDTTPPPNKLGYELKASGNANAQMKISIHLKTLPSRYTFNPAQGKFENPDPTKIISLSHIGGRPLVDALKTTSADSSLRNFLGGWLGGEGYKSSDIATRCADLRIELSKHFSSRDVAATYWALLQTYANSLKKSHAEYTSCVEDVRAQYESMNLKFSQF